MLKYVGRDHPGNRLPAALLAELVDAQDSLLAAEFADAFAFASKVAEDLRLDLGIPADLRGASVSVLTGKSHSELRRFWGGVLQSSGIPEQARALHVLNLAQQTQLVEAFRRPESALQRVRTKVREVVANFPRTAADIEVGRNPGDVIDPYILAATQYLMCGGDFERAIGHLAGRLVKWFLHDGTVIFLAPAMHPAIAAILKFFSYAHLPKHLQERSEPFAKLADELAFGPQNDETAAALRKLLEAKDCAVRAWL